MDMKFYWVRDQLNQGQFLIYSRPGSDSLVDYFTKHQPTSHHCRMCPKYLMPSPTSNIYALVYLPERLWGWDKTGGKPPLKFQSSVTQSVTNWCSNNIAYILGNQSLLIKLPQTFLNYQVHDVFLLYVFSTNSVDIISWLYPILFYSCWSVQFLQKYFVCA